MLRLLSLIVLSTIFFTCQSGKDCSPDGKCCAAKNVETEISKIDYESKLRELGITLTKPGEPVANYVHARRAGNMLYLSGKGPGSADGTSITGKVGADLTIEEGYDAARRCAINHISVLQDYLGDLNRVKKVVKVLGMVNCTPDFKDQSKVINGYSDLMVEVFGEKGKHARSAVGMGSLPSQIAAEVEVIVEIYD